MWDQINLGNSGWIRVTQEFLTLPRIFNGHCQSPWKGLHAGKVFCFHFNMNALFQAALPFSDQFPQDCIMRAISKTIQYKGHFYPSIIRARGPVLKKHDILSNYMNQVEKFLFLGFHPCTPLYSIISSWTTGKIVVFSIIRFEFWISW